MEEPKKTANSEQPELAPENECWTPLRVLALPLRFLGTAVAFGAFGMSGLIFRFGITPYLSRIEKDERTRIRISRFIVQRWFALFVSAIDEIGLVRVVVKNSERLARPGLVIIANHPSLIDVVCLISHIPQATTIVKAKLLENWFTRAPILAANYVSNDEGPAALRKLEKDLDAGASFVIFPEGTRTPVDLPKGEYPRLHRGAAALAFETNRPVTPVRISASPRWLTKDRSWWHMPPVRMTLTLEVLDDIPVEPLLSLYNERPSLAVRRFTKALQSKLFD